MIRQCQCLTKNGKGPQCSKEAKSGQRYCGQHVKMACQFPIKTEQKSQRDLLEDKLQGSLSDVIDENIAEQICHELDLKEDYHGLVNLSKQNKLFHQKCQPYLNREKERRDAEQKLYHWNWVGLSVLTNNGKLTLLDITQPIPKEIDPTSLQKLILPRSHVYKLSFDLNDIDSIESFIQGPATIQDLYEFCHEFFLNNLKFSSEDFPEGPYLFTNKCPIHLRFKKDKDIYFMYLSKRDTYTLKFYSTDYHK